MAAIGLGLVLGGTSIVQGNHLQAAPDVCDPLDSGKIDTTGDPLTVTVTAPAGFLISGYCVKAGSAQSGGGPEYITLGTPVASYTFGHSTGKAVSHYSVSYIPSATTTVPSSSLAAPVIPSNWKAGSPSTTPIRSRASDPTAHPSPSGQMGR